MHREIQIKQFPIVTTHWWPKTRNERFVWENEQYLYRFFTSCTQPCPSDLSAHTQNFSTFQAPLEESANQIASCKYPIPFMQHQRSMWLVVVTMTARQHHASDTPSIKRWRRRPVWMQREPERAHTHVTHTLHTHVTHRMCAHTQITWTWLCTRGKKNYINTVLFPSYRDSDLYLPLYDWQTRTVWPKNIKIGSTEEKKTPTSWMPLG